MFFLDSIGTANLVTNLRFDSKLFIFHWWNSYFEDEKFNTTLVPKPEIKFRLYSQNKSIKHQWI